MRVPIGYITYALERNPGGIGQYTRCLLEALCSGGCDPVILQSGGWPDGLLNNHYSTISLPGSKYLPGLLTLGQVEIGWQGTAE